MDGVGFLLTGIKAAGGERAKRKIIHAVKLLERVPYCFKNKSQSPNLKNIFKRGDKMIIFLDSSHFFPVLFFMLLFSMHSTYLALRKSLHCFKMKILKSIKHEPISIAKTQEGLKTKTRRAAGRRRKIKRGRQERKAEKKAHKSER